MMNICLGLLPRQSVFKTAGHRLVPNMFYADAMAESGEKMSFDDIFRSEFLESMTVIPLSDMIIALLLSLLLGL